MSWLIHCLFLATAGPGYYDEESLAAASRTFREATAAAETYRDAAARTGAVATALADLRLGLDLLGEDAPDAQRARLEALERRFARERATLQAFVDTLTRDFDRAFRDAMARAVATTPGAVRCEARRPVGPRLPGLPRRERSDPDCTGEDLNGVLAEKMDADPILRREVAEIQARPWPEITVDRTPQAAIGPGSRAIPVVSFARAVLPEALQDIDRAEEEARLPIDAAVEAGVTDADLPRLRARVAAIEAEVAAARAAAFSDVRAAVERIGGPGTAWCANPGFLGGCTVPPVDDGAIATLSRHRRVIRAARRR